jgi:hypothetical protein
MKNRGGSAILAIFLLASGCGGDGNNGVGGGGGTDAGFAQLDGHLQTGCTEVSDCDDGNPCHKPSCQSGVCSYQDVQCPAPDGCNAAACDPKDGQCKTTPVADGLACTTSGSMPGTCMSGFCAPLPTCYDPNTSYASVFCDSGAQDDSTLAANSYNTPTMAIDDYSCDKGMTGPETAYQFSPDADGDVTVELTAKAPAGTDGGVADPDLDLVILDGTCDGTAVCANPPLPGGGYAGITNGTGKEHVTFHALASHTYYLVVDGRAGAVADYRLEITACGACQPSPTTTLACNASMPLGGDTSKGMNTLGMYTCTKGTGTQSVTAAGNEQVFLFSTVAPVAQNVTAKVVNASKPVTLLALPSTSGACDPTSCLGSAAATGTAGSMTASLTFSAAPDYSGPAHYWVVVDTAAAGADATFGLQLSCGAYCSNDSYADVIDCSQKSVTSGANNGATGSTNDVSAWGPSSGACGGMTNLSGPEYVYLFHKQTTTTKPKYRFTLASLTDGKQLGLVVLDAGTTAPANCDPTQACAVTAPVTVAATSTQLASTGTYVAAGPKSTIGGTDGKTAVADLTTGVLAEHWYYVVVDGVGGDVGDFALSIDSGCP